jgi:hypothetical protein
VLGYVRESGRCSQVSCFVIEPIHALTLFFDAFGVSLIGSYLPSATARAPEDEPSTNSMGGGSKLLKASMSLAGRNWE